MKTTMLIACIIFAAAPAFARLGETPQQIEARYGKPVAAVHVRRLAELESAYFGLPSTNYLFKEYTITVTFKDGKSVCEAVAASQDELLSVDNCRALRDRIGAGREWHEQFKGDDKTGRWITNDGWRAEKEATRFVVMHADFITHAKAVDEERKKAKAEADKKKADGF